MGKTARCLSLLPALAGLAIAVGRSLSEVGYAG